MGKGSQLSQLKSALSQAGISRSQSNGKKRKRSQQDEKEKERKVAKLHEIQQKMNPFDVKVTKLKHDVGGRKIAGVMGRPSQSKQAGMEQRKKSLLKELRDRDRSGGIIDRRFGENDPTMTPEERMLERFTRERQRTSKGVSFNIEDEDDLTHYGQSLSKMDDFDHIAVELDEEDEEAQIDRKTVQKTHFGGFGDDVEEDEGDEQSEKKKSKAEVMAEVIAKSKEHKFIRQQQQEEDEDLRHELDQELDSLRSLLYATAPDTASGPTHEVDDETETVKNPVVAVNVQDKEEDKEYDQFVRELAFERRAKPKDRTKREEEIAKEEKEALEKAERRRTRRMNGEDDSDSEGEELGRKRKRKRGGDDLEDDFMEETGEWDGSGSGLDTRLSDKGEEAGYGEDDENEGDEEDGAEYDADSDEEGDEEEIGEIEGGEHEELVKSVKPKHNRKEPSSESKKEIPYTFQCPSTHEEFLGIIEDVDDEDVAVVVKRIRTLHHPSLAEDNKFKLQVLTGVLLDHILYITSSPKPRFSVMSALMPHLFALTRLYPIQSAKYFIDKLNLMHKNLRRGLSHGVTELSAKTWPGLAEQSFLRLIGIVWPTSDMNHLVVSPARLLMGSYLGLCRVRSVQDLASGLFLCTLFFQYEKLSQRLVPEAINFLLNTVLYLAPHNFKDEASLPGTFPSPDFGSERCSSLAIRNAKKLKIQHPDLTQFLTRSAADEQSKVNLLSTSVELLGQYGDAYKSLTGFIELYEPAVTILKGVELDKLSIDLSAKISSTIDTLRRLLKFARQARRPLALQAHKPIPIPTYIPRFEQSSSNYLRNRDPDHERNEAAKLRAQYKEERKGAIRELRKDAKFLAAEQQKAQKEKDRTYNQKMNKVFSSLESERAEQKAMEKEKMKEKKRAGRK